MRRNRVVMVVGTLIGLLTVLVAGGAGWLKYDTATRAAVLQDRIERALDETKDYYERHQMPEAHAALKRADDLLAGDPSNVEMQQRGRQWKADLAMVERIHEIRLQQSEVKDRGFDMENADPALRDAFLQYGLSFFDTDPEAVAERIKNAAIKEHLIGALDHWLRLEPKGSDQLRTIVNRADPDEWRVRLRDALQRKDVDALETMAREKRVQALPASSQLDLAMTLETLDRLALTVELLRETQRRYTSDFWVNHELGRCLRKLKPPRSEEAAGYYRAALALRPGNPGVRVNLGNTLREQKLSAEAEAEYRAALAIRPDFVLARKALAIVLVDQGRFDEATREYKEIVRVNPKDTVARSLLADALERQGRGKEAVPELKENVRIQPVSSTSHVQLGDALFGQGKLDDALVEFKVALALVRMRIGMVHWRKGNLKEAALEFKQASQDDPENADIRFQLGTIYLFTGNNDGAIVEYRAALRHNPKNVRAHINLAVVLRRKGLVSDSIEELKEAIRLDPRQIGARYNLGNSLSQYSLRDEAVLAYQEALRLKPDYAEAHANLGDNYRSMGFLDEARAAFREALRIKPNLAEAKNGLREVETVLKPSDASGHQKLAHYSLFRKRLMEAEAEARVAIKMDATFDLAYCTLAEILYRQGKIGDSETVLQEALALKPGDPNALQNVGVTYAALGQWDKASAIFRRMQQMTPDQAGTWQQHVLTLLAEKKLGECQTVYKEMYGKFGSSNDAPAGDLLVIVGGVVPEAGVDSNRLVELAAKAEPRMQAPVLFRAGKYQQAIDRLEQSAQATRLFRWDWFVLAMAHHRLGHSKEAADAFATGIRTMQETKDSPSIPWISRVRQDALRAEAESLLKKAR